MISPLVPLIVYSLVQIVAAAPSLLVRSDKANLAPILSAVNTVSSSLNVLDVQIQTLAVGNTQGALAVFNSASQFQQSMTSATAQINAVTGTLSVNDALKLKDSTDSLATQVQQAMSDLITKQPVIMSLGVTAQTAQLIQSQKASSTALSNALLVKVPSAGQNIAQKSVATISSAIDQAIQVYSVAAVTIPASSPAASIPAQPVAPAAPAPSFGTTQPTISSAGMPIRRTLFAE